MKKITSLILFLCLSTILLAQNQAYYVKQTQISEDLKNYTPLPTNSIFTKILVKENGIELNMSNGKYSFIENSEIDKVNLKGTAYRYEISLSGTDITLFFTPYPYETSEPKLLMAIVALPGLIEANPDAVTFFRLVFHEDLVISE